MKFNMKNRPRIVKVSSPLECDGAIHGKGVKALSNLIDEYERWFEGFERELAKLEFNVCKKCNFHGECEEVDCPLWEGVLEILGEEGE